MDYRALRAVIGGIALLLVPVVYFGNWLIFTRQLNACVYSPHWVPGSLSGFYYTHMRNLFVGAMCAMGVFFAAYRGHDRWDNRLTNVAGIAAICIALFPTTPPVYSTSPNGPNLFFTRSNLCGPSTAITYHLSPHQSWFRDVHVVSLFVLFVMVFLMVLVQFTRSAPSKAEQQPAVSGSFAHRIRAGWNALRAWWKSLFPVGQLARRLVAWWNGLVPENQPGQRRSYLRRLMAAGQNLVFVACAGGITVAALLAVVAAIWPSVGEVAPLLLFAESLAFLFFGIAWYVKGGAPWLPRRRAPRALPDDRSSLQDA